MTSPSTSCIGTWAQTQKCAGSVKDMNLTVFGGTGATGTLLIAQALEVGHHVTTYVRRPDSMSISDDALEVRVGQLDDSKGVSAAIQGADAVISTLGPGLRRTAGTPLTEGMRHITAAMTQHGVSRLIAISTPSAPEPRDRSLGARRPAVAVLERVFPRGYAEMVGQAQVVRASDLDWTLVRVSLLVNGPAKPVRAGLLGHGDVGVSITRASLAAFMLDQAVSTTWVGLAPAVSN